MKTKHTPLPWHFQDEYIRADSENMDDSGNVVADVYCKPSTTHAEIMEANAAFIVRACNSHDELVAALESMMPERIGYGQSMSIDMYLNAVDKARAALAKAKGE